MEGVEYGIFLQNSIRMYPINTGGLSIVLYILNHDQNNRSMDVPAKIDSQTFRMIWPLLHYCEWIMSPKKMGNQKLLISKWKQSTQVTGGA